MEVRWTSMPPNGCAADRRTPGGKQGEGQKSSPDNPVIFRFRHPLPLTPSREGRGSPVFSAVTVERPTVPFSLAKEVQGGVSNIYVIF
jgi:hypothetical protein